MQEFMIDENDFYGKTCRDTIMLSDENNKEYLDEDDDNILIIIQRGKNYIIDCYTGEYLQEVLYDDTKGRYVCLENNSVTGRPLYSVDEDGNKVNFPLNVVGFVDTEKLFYKLDLSFGSFYISKKDLLDMIKSGNRIFYLEEENKRSYPYTASKGVYDAQKLGGESDVVSSDHCQEGTDITVYRIKVCGGTECLSKIFRKFVPREILTDTDWKINQNPYTKISEEKLEEGINLGEGQIELGLPISSQTKEIEIIEIDGDTTIENILIEIYNFYNEYPVSEDDVKYYEETPELDEALSKIDDNETIFRKDLLGRRINFTGLKKDGDMWVVNLE